MYIEDRGMWTRGAAKAVLGSVHTVSTFFFVLLHDILKTAINRITCYLFPTTASEFGFMMHSASQTRQLIGVAGEQLTAAYILALLEMLLEINCFFSGLCEVRLKMTASTFVSKANIKKWRIWLKRPQPLNVNILLIRLYTYIYTYI